MFVKKKQLDAFLFIFQDTYTHFSRACVGMKDVLSQILIKGQKLRMKSHCERFCSMADKDSIHTWYSPKCYF